MVPPIHLGAWSMALMLWLPFELLLLLLFTNVKQHLPIHQCEHTYTNVGKCETNVGLHLHVSLSYYVNVGPHL